MPLLSISGHAKFGHRAQFPISRFRSRGRRTPNKDKWYGVKVVKKVKGKWFLLDARPESREAADTTVAAFKSVRAM